MNSTYNHSKKVSRVSFIDDDTKQNKSKIQLESISNNDSFEKIKSQASGQKLTRDLVMKIIST